MNFSPIFSPIFFHEGSGMPASGSQAQSKPATTQAEPVTSTPLKLAVPQKQAPAQAQPQAQAQAQMWPLAIAQPPRPAPAYFPQPGRSPQGLDTCLKSLLDEDKLTEFQRAKPL